MIKIPYTLKIILPVIRLGASLQFFFRIPLFFTAGSLSGPAQMFFLWGTPFCLLFLGLFFFLRYGLGLFYGNEVEIINKNVSNDQKLNFDLSKEEIKETLKLW